MISFNRELDVYPLPKGSTCEALLCMERTEYGVVVDFAQSTFASFDGSWFELTFNKGQMCWRCLSAQPEAPKSRSNKIIYSFSNIGLKHEVAGAKLKGVSEVVDNNDISITLYFTNGVGVKISHTNGASTIDRVPGAVTLGYLKWRIVALFAILLPALAGFGYESISGFQNGRVLIAGYGGVIVSRDSQPFAFWYSELFWIVGFAVMIFGVVTALLNIRTLLRPNKTFKPPWPRRRPSGLI